jgi:hypothetical protein
VLLLQILCDSQKSLKSICLASEKAANRAARAQRGENKSLIPSIMARYSVHK